jgi:hypothetical protein
VKSMVSRFLATKVLPLSTCPSLFSLCRLKINQALGSKTCVYSLYTSPHGSEQ